MKTLQKQDASLNSSRAQANQPSTQGIGRPAVHGHFSLPAQLKKGVIQCVWYKLVGDTVTEEAGDKPAPNTHKIVRGYGPNKITVWTPKGEAPKSNIEKMASYPDNGIFEVDAADVMYSQSSISAKFTDGRSYSETIEKFKKSGYTITPIRVLEGNNSRLISLDNRRLYCAKQANVKVKCVWASAEQIEKDDFKFTSTKGYEGKSTIKVNL